VRVEFPFEITYLTEGTTPIDEVIDGLIAAKFFIEEGGYNLSKVVPGLHVEQVQVSMRRLSQESSLREVIFVAVYLTVQENLEREVPALVETLTGIHVGDNFKTILTLSVLAAIFYGAAYAKDLVSSITTDTKIKRQLNAIIEDLASRTGRTEAEVKKILDQRYKPKGKLRALADTAYRFFRPSKSQDDAPIRINDKEIPKDVISEVPPNFAYERILESSRSRPFSQVELELHAQDRDRESVGWAAIPKGISEKRLKMKLLDGVTPEQIWGRDSVTGDIIVTYKRVGMDMVPSEIHLTRIL
jgi:hypothetical protein